METIIHEPTPTRDDLQERIKTLENRIALLEAESEGLFRGLFDHMTSGSGIYEVKNDGRSGSDYIIRGFNRKSLELENKTLDQVIGKSLFDLRPNIDDYGLIRAMRRVWKTGESAYYPVKIYQDEKFSNYYENHIFRIPSGEVVTIYNDVTDEKNAEVALKESKERFELAMRFANDGLFDWNLETNAIYYSTGWKKMLGYGDDEIKNDFSEWERLTRTEDVKASWGILDEVLAGKRDRFEKEFKMRHKNGHWVDVLSRANVVKNAEGKPVRMVGTHVDITERKNFDARMRQAQKMEAVGTLAGGIAHDFNNILGIIIGNTELAADDIPEWNPARFNLEEIRTASLRARDVVRQLLSFSRKSEQKKRPLGIQDIVKETLQLLRATIPKSIDIRSSIKDGPAAIMADPTQIHQVLINLCTNAVHAMEETGDTLEIGLSRIELDTETALGFFNIPPGAYVQLTVSDNGCGIAPEIKDRIFDPYFSTKDIGKGSGLGLSVVSGIVKSHDGAISVYSEPGVGTTVRMLFPVIDEAVEPENHLSSETSGGNENVLLIDDEAAMLNMERQMLERLGYRVAAFSSPLAALKAFRADPGGFDLAITDMTMPEMTGDKLTAEILRLRPDIPVILCTGFSERITQQSAGAMGIARYIEKPVNKRELSSAIRDVLSGRLKTII